MTLIIATIMKQGAVVVADRRTIVFSHSTGEERVLTDNAEKLLVKDNLLICTVGESKTLKDSAKILLRSWLDTNYDPTQPIEPQLNKLYTDKFTSGNYGYFIAFFCDREGVTVVQTWHEYTIERITNDARFTIKFFGSGNQLAGDLVEERKPKFDTFDPEAMLEFSAEIIQATHDKLAENKDKLPGVGRAIMGAIVTEDAIKLLYKAEN